MRFQIILFLVCLVVKNYAQSDAASGDDSPDDTTYCNPKLDPDCVAGDPEKEKEGKKASCNPRLDPDCVAGSNDKDKEGKKATCNPRLDPDCVAGSSDKDKKGKKGKYCNPRLDPDCVAGDPKKKGKKGKYCNPKLDPDCVAGDSKKKGKKASCNPRLDPDCVAGDTRQVEGDDTGSFQKEFPGTTWCIGKNPGDPSIRGSFGNVDECCMTHSMCPKSIRPEKEKYGLSNTFGYTARSCDCEKEFAECLFQAAKTASGTGKKDEAFAAKAVFDYIVLMGQKCIEFQGDVDESQEEEVDIDPLADIAKKKKNKRKGKQGAHKVSVWAQPKEAWKRIKAGFSKQFG